MCLCSKQSSLFSFYALPSGGKSKDAVVHLGNRNCSKTWILKSEILTSEFRSSVEIQLATHTHFRVTCCCTIKVRKFSKATTATVATTAAKEAKVNLLKTNSNFLELRVDYGSR